MKQVVFLLVLALLLTTVSTLTLGVHMAEADDVTPPQLVSFDFSPTAVDVSGGPQIVTFTARITDDLSGFETGYASLQSPSMTQGKSATWYASILVSGDNHDGVYQATCQIPQYSEEGTWTVHSILLADKVGNSLPLQQSDLISRGLPNTFTVTGEPHISGLVRDELGNPVPNVLISAQEKATGTEIASTTSGSDGWYSVSVPVGIYNLIVTPPVESGLASKTVESVEVASDLALDIILAAAPPALGVLFSGRVVDQYDTTAFSDTSSGYLSLVGQGGSYPYVPCKHGFSLRVNPGVYSVTIECDDWWGPAWSLYTSINLQQDTDVTYVVQTRSLNGIVLDPQGNPQPSVGISASGSFAFDGLTGSFWSRPGGSDAQGNFAISVFSSNSVTLTANPPVESLYGPITMSGIDVTEDTNVVVTLSAPASGILFSGRVVDQYGNPPLTGTSSTMLFLNGMQVNCRKAQFSTRLDPGVYSVTIECDDWWGPYWTLVSSVDLQQDTDVTYTLQTRVLSGIVLDPQGNPQSGVRIAASGNFAFDGLTGSFSSCPVVSDAQGNFVIGVFSSNDVTLAASPPVESLYGPLTVSNVDVTEDKTVVIALVHKSVVVTFAQSGVDPDFAGQVITIDRMSYGINDLPVSLLWDVGSIHSFSYASILSVNDGKQYVWGSTTGLSTAETGSITVTGSGGITGNYVTQYYLTVQTNPQGVNSPSGQGWYNAGSQASISSSQYVDIVLGSSRYRFNGWMTADQSELADASAPSTTILIDRAKTVTANYVTQYSVSFAVAPSGAGSTTPSGASVWEEAGYLSLSATASAGYTFSSWSSSTTFITFLVPGSSSTTATISGSGTVTANFAHKPTTYTVTFTENGLPSGTSWSVIFDTVQKYSTLSTITFNNVREGTYQWSVATPISGGTGTRYVASISSGSMTIPAQTTQGVAFRTQYYLTMNTNFGTTSPSSDWFDAESIISISASSPSTIIGERYLGPNWSGSGAGSYSGTANPAIQAVVMQGPISEIAKWNHQYLLTVTTSGMPSPYSTSIFLGGNLAGSANDATPFAVWLVAGTRTGSIGVNDMVSGSTGTRHVFTSWSDGVTNNPRSSVQMNAPVTFTADYRTQYYLTMSTNFGTTAPSSSWFDAGSMITIRATAPSATIGERYQWLQWTGSGSGSYNGKSNPMSNALNMQGPVSESAAWSHQYLLTIRTNGLPANYPTKVSLGGNDVGAATDTLPCTIWLGAGSSTGAIKVDSPVSGASGTVYVFTSWNGGITVNPRPSLVMNNPQTLVANFQMQYLVTFTESGLPDGTSWSTTLDGHIQSSTTASIIFTKPPGTYSFSISNSIGQFGSNKQSFVPNPQTGTAKVATSSVSQLVKFYANLITQNWAGYMVVSSLPNPTSTLTLVSGSWKVQSIDATWSYTTSCQWIGIGGLGDFTFNGDKDKTLIQVGTYSQSQYYWVSNYVWYEILPDNASVVPIGSGYPVNAGDNIQAEISLQNAATNLWKITISASSGSTQKWQWSRTFIFHSSMYTAEWIEEHPITSSSSTLANFHTAQYGPDYTSFSGMNWATVNGNTAVIGQQTYIAKITMTNANKQKLAEPSSLTADGTSFLVTWDSSS